MQISGSIPIHVARAYGVAPPRGTGAVPAEEAPRAIEPRRAEPVSAKLRELIGGTVRVPIDFSTASPSSDGSFQLYTRAADKIEAAVGVRLGRAIDVKG